MENAFTDREVGPFYIICMGNAFTYKEVGRFYRIDMGNAFTYREKGEMQKGRSFNTVQCTCWSGL